MRPPMGGVLGYNHRYCAALLCCCLRGHYGFCSACCGGSSTGRALIGIEQSLQITLDTTSLLLLG